MPQHSMQISRQSEDSQQASIMPQSMSQGQLQSSPRSSVQQQQQQTSDVHAPHEAWATTMLQSVRNSQKRQAKMQWTQQSGSKQGWQINQSQITHKDKEKTKKLKLKHKYFQLWCGKLCIESKWVMHAQQADRWNTIRIWQTEIKENIQRNQFSSAVLIKRIAKQLWHYHANCWADQTKMISKSPRVPAWQLGELMLPMPAPLINI